MGLFTATLAAALAADPAGAELPTAPPPRPATDPEAAKHLAAWKKAADGRKNIRAVFSLTRSNTLEGFREEHSNGAFLAMKPDLFRFRLAGDRDHGYEAYIRDGDSVFYYDGHARTVTEVALKPQQAADPAARASPEQRLRDWLKSGGEPFALRCLTGVDPERYAVSLAATGKGVVDLEFEPRSEQDQAYWYRARVRLTGPDADAPYVPIEVRVERRDATVKVWRFADVRADLFEIDREVFRYEPVPGFKLVTPRRDSVKSDQP
jgi:TIGR03009 family protein